MDIKLKNSHRLTIVLILTILLVCSVGMVMSYPVFSRELQERLEEDSISEDILTEICEHLVKGNYILYNEATEVLDRAYILQEYGGDQFDLLRKYMDYEVFDWAGNALLNNNSKTTLAALAKKEDTAYALRVAFTFQEYGQMSDIRVNGSRTDERIQYNIEQRLLVWRDAGESWMGMSGPEEVQVIYGITEENLNSYIENNQDIENLSVYKMMGNELFVRFITVFVLILAAAAIFLSVKQNTSLGNHRIFSTPFEIVVCVLVGMLGTEYFVTKVVWLTISEGLTAYLTGGGSGSNGFFSAFVNVVMWFVIFGIVFWGFICLSAMFTMKKAYWTQRTLCARFLRWMKNGSNAYGKKVRKGADGVWNKTKNFCSRQYDMLLHLDFQDKTNRTIFEIVAFNFAVLVLICSMWFYGILALIIYSAVLFLFLKKYFKDIQARYKLLLQATNRLAEGDLDTPIEEDMGIFNPIQEELKKIQDGFKKAVEEEVKSERMKTELVTNVSHDLKTPLTAIITYTDLLKNETEEEKRKEYIQVLERKSLRLKVLIEDLFEISKAASNNVIMNFMWIDIVDLLKQVGLEYDSKIKETNLDFRWTLPEQKIVLWLDSQKTYRIFENLIINIIKYAMPHTRVYVEMKELDDQVYISMKNISAAELDFDTDEITDRFVRGDASRNTEGSGLGLAIAKSFTELQNGSLKISADADLYKVEIIFFK
ncbi:sensor histidine kinase [Faecalicatena contorta]|uniref:histidine kinase n=1 Tax=Faecalicatena contorta TaxID=39482 RepID=A0A315ZR24_9FIRM|nr:HAMP domain-containing sensor histidine kinase [Faecalicatena contorta]PWJ47450.1 signal transduction histidine kinase [Faecalicatena contorta]SUQ16010.1 Signal transduction histidine kinase [Faecalicatena contorta]